LFIETIRWEELMRKLAFVLLMLLSAGSLPAQAAPQHNQGTKPSTSQPRAWLDAVESQQSMLAQDSPCGGPPAAFLMTEDPQTVKIFGVVEDSGRTTICWRALQRAREVKAAGYNAVRLLVRWGPGYSSGINYPDVLEPLSTLVQAYQSLGIRVIINISPNWDPNAKNVHMPIGASDQRQFATFVASYAHLLPTVRFWQVGMEPNSNTFWRPQCRPGTVADAPVAFERLMALSYDALRSAEEDRPGQLSLVVIGPAPSSHGESNPGNECSSHSPVRFFQDVGEALDKSGRDKPIWDWASIDPYGLTNTESPAVTHTGGTIGLGDLDALPKLLCQAFRGTAQPCKTPIFISEYGVGTGVPADLESRYFGKENVQVVDYDTHALYDTVVIRMAYCRPWIRGMMHFLLIDEPDKARWQSGQYYAEDDSDPDAPLIAKPFTDSIQQMLFAAQDGAISCASR
jgi:hypothetical protein